MFDARQLDERTVLVQVSDEWALVAHRGDDAITLGRVGYPNGGQIEPLAEVSLGAALDGSPPKGRWDASDE